MIARPLTGIFPPIVTPLRDRDTLDVPAFERLVEHLIAGGVHGLFFLGTTGEGPSLSTRLRAEVVERGCRLVAGRLPVLIGVTDTSFVESVRLGERAAAAGADAVVVAPPSYFAAAQDELVGYVKRLAGVMPLPIFLYHIPHLTKVGFGPEAVRRLVDVPGVIGIKDSGREMPYLHDVRQIASGRPDFTILVGPEELLAEAVLLGAHGAMCGGANMVPRLYVDLYNAARSGDLPRVRDLHARVMRISSALYTVGPPESSYLRGLKCALGLLGLCDDVLAEPFERFGPAERETIRHRLRELEMLPVG
ncbi:MAG: dihydrodipicolinate synthase family protein [Zavarzinella sp.]|nr:dihydrodipicolinate synthase family protein [Zavarzinella sp.]